MTATDSPAPRKPRRLGLFIPWAMAAMLAVAWSGGWFWLKGETERKMDAARAQAAKAGWRLDWASRKISGFPFRLNVDLTNARWGDSAGWSVTAPVLNVQAYVSRTDSWMMVAPAGVAVVRPNGEPFTVIAKVLRGSVSDLGVSPPRLSVESLGLRFSTPAGAQPLWAQTAAEFHLHLRAGPNDQAALYVELDQAAPGGATGGNGPETSIIDAIISHAGAFRGPSISAAVQSWKRVGGKLTIHRLENPPHSPFAWGVIDQ